MKVQSSYLLKLVLWLIAIHSFVAGLLLIILGDDGITFFGFREGGDFFQIQGGVFHLVMCVAYIIAANYSRANQGVIIFIISAKFIATIYLILYYVLAEPIITVLLSGFADGLMGILVLLIYRSLPSGFFTKSSHA